jgi:branched-chain amino acid transport system substrate-binding protein
MNTATRTHRFRRAGVWISAALALTMLAACGGREDTADSGSESAGITDTTVKIGTSMAMSGGGSAYNVVAKGAQAYFDYVNAEGGVEMADGKTREIDYKVMDDAYDPSRTVSNVRDLVENWGAFSIFMTLGSSPNLAIYDYLNDREIPQVYNFTGNPQLNNADHPWTLNYVQGYDFEAEALTKYILDKVDKPKVAFLLQGDDFGKTIKEVYLDAFEGTGIEVVEEQSYDVSATNIDSQMTAIANSGANTFVDYATGNFATQALQKMKELGWKPDAMVANSASVSISGIFKPAGLDAAKGVAAVFTNKDPSDAQWADDEGLKEYEAIMGEHGAGLDPKDILVSQGYIMAQLLVEALRNTEDPTRKGFMDAVTNMDYAPGLLLPGVSVKTTPDYLFALTSVQVEEFDGEKFVPVGDVVTRED